MSDFAPGPYHVGYDTDLGTEILDVGDWLIARVLIDRAATARLMAAAPDLLAALETIVEAQDAGRFLSPSGPLFTTAKAAIAAAYGLETTP